jgi:hypothetical protein
MATAPDRIRVRLFPAPPPASCCDSPSGVSGEDAFLHPNEVLTRRRDAVERWFEGRVDVEFASYASREGIYAAMEQLNAALLASGRDEVVSPANFYTFIGRVAPIVVVDGRIAFTESVPDWPALRSAIERSLVPA